MDNESTIELTERTELVGREKEMERLRDCLEARGENHFIYYWAHGGLGKTRLLEELQQLVADAEPGFYSSGIIDLYHTDTHSTSDVERAIVEGLDPDQKYFTRYRRERSRFELLRERGIDPSALEKRRDELSQLFVEGFRDMALDARKLVICFDTVELLQYESSIVEEIAELDTMDTRIKPWLLDKLAQLKNVLVVFAGRPKLPAPGETSDPQARLVRDMEQAFGGDLTRVQLRPFTLKETQDFVETLAEQPGVIPAQYLPIVHRLTGGRPVFLHLIVDLLQALSPAPREVLELFDGYADLVEAPEDDERLAEARQHIEAEILRNVFNETGELGGYLSRLALMPKGVDIEILHQVLGLPLNEAERLLAQLAPLSFVKQFKALPGAERLHSRRIFLHDEMYRLLTSDVIRNLRINERQVSHTLVTNYYDSRVADLESQISRLPPGERIGPRERLQKLQVERLYYVLACDPCQGYAEYKQLSDQANRRRWVGFSMRLLDEFLRFYNTPERRDQFAKARISYEQIIRESAQMWVERFHWWGQYSREDQFARRILDQPEAFFVRPETDLAILGNICALWARARGVLYGYDSGVIQEALAMLDRMPPLAECGPQQSLARARLATTTGYLFRLGGLLASAAEQYVEGKAAFRKAEDVPDEVAILLNNLAFVYAKQGRMALANPLAHEALRLNEEMGNDYSTGLTLSNLSGIAQMRGNYPQAVIYGEEALALFRELEDSHGTVLAHLSIVQARRRIAKHRLETGRKLEAARHMLEEANRSLEKVLEMAEEAGLGADIPTVRAEQGRVYRELGHIVRRLESFEEALGHYMQSERQLRRALETKEWATLERADTLQDIAETLFFSGDEKEARERLNEVEALIGEAHRIVPGEQVPEPDVPHEHFAPLGKVEMTRGQMAFTRGDPKRGLQHYILAYAYLMHFSPDAVEKDTLLEYLYNRLRALAGEEQQALLLSIHTWAQEHDMGVDTEPFVQTLKDLLGV